ncbi:MAG TPA: carotenoid biosynthesis protein [Thermoanaerobaculia bacterium]|nr:carotenoid biosynthesis protein [Thermoanaerobaculia bacterium]
MAHHRVLAHHWSGRGGGEKALVGIITVVALVVVALELRPLVDGAKVPFMLLVPIFALFSLLHAGFVLGWRHAFLFFALSAVISLGSELIGTETGLIFGRYHYTDVLGPKLFGEVPIVIPLTWFLMIYPSYLIANLIVEGRLLAQGRRLAHLVSMAFLGALVMTAWDLTLDPYMVSFEKAWVWDQPGSYFGIPIHNYVGWLATTFVVMLLYRLLERRRPPRPIGGPSRWLAAAPLATYGFMSIGDVALGHPVETVLISPFAMGIPLLFAATAFARPERLRGIEGAASPAAVSRSGSERGVGLDAP